MVRTTSRLTVPLILCPGRKWYLFSILKLCPRKERSEDFHPEFHGTKLWT